MTKEKRILKRSGGRLVPGETAATFRRPRNAWKAALRLIARRTGIPAPRLAPTFGETPHSYRMRQRHAESGYVRSNWDIVRLEDTPSLRVTVLPFVRFV